MNNSSILIVEDEPIIADDIALTLEDFGYKVHGIAASVEEAIMAIQGTPPQLALVDISLEGSRNGIELGGLLSTKYHIPFMYITSHFDEDTIRQVKITNPMAYLIKPFDNRDLKINLELAFSKKNVPDFKPTKLFVKNKNQLIPIAPHQITHVEAIDNYAFVHTATGKYMISHTLKSIEEKLVHNGIVRVHKSYLVNLEHINAISDGFILLDKAQIPLGKAYKQSFYDYIVTL